MSLKNLSRLAPFAIVTMGVTLFLTNGLEPAQVKGWLHSFGLFAPAIFVVAGVIMMSVCVPKTVMSMIAGALFGTWWGSGLMLVTAVTAAMLNYAIGRFCLSKMTVKRQHSEVARAVVELAGEAGLMRHLLIRLSPIPTMLISYLMGACRARIVPYALAAAIAMIPQVLWVHSGTAATIANDGDVSMARKVSVIVAFLVAVVISIWIPRDVIGRLREYSIAQVQ